MEKNGLLNKTGITGHPREINIIYESPESGVPGTIISRDKYSEYIATILDDGKVVELSIAEIRLGHLIITVFYPIKEPITPTLKLEDNKEIEGTGDIVNITTHFEIDDEDITCEVDYINKLKNAIDLTKIHVMTVFFDKNKHLNDNILNNN